MDTEEKIFPVDSVRRIFHEANTRLDEEQFLLQLLEEELSYLCLKNEQNLPSNTEISEIYQLLQSSLTQADSDAIFVAILDSIKGVARTGRQEIKQIIHKYVHKMSLVKKLISKEDINEHI